MEIPPGDELRDHQDGLDRLSQPHGIGKKQPDSAAANGSQNRDEIDRVTLGDEAKLTLAIMLVNSLPETS